MAATAIGKLAFWAGSVGVKKFGQYVDNVLDNFSKSFGTNLGKTLSTPAGLAGVSLVIGGLFNGPTNSVKELEGIVKAVLAATGHPIP
jgi:hypothetical protein